MLSPDAIMAHVNYKLAILDIDEPGISAVEHTTRQQRLNECTGDLAVLGATTEPYDYLLAEEEAAKYLEVLLGHLARGNAL